MRYLLLLVFLLPSCSLYENLKENAERVNEGLAKIAAGAEAVKAGAAAGQKLVAAGVEKIQELGVRYETAKAEADTNKDGKTSAQEWLLYLALGGGGLGGLEVGRRKMQREREDLLRRNAESDQRKARMEVELDAIKARLSTMP
jgi:hypothetical protein